MHNVVYLLKKYAIIFCIYTKSLGRCCAPMMDWLGVNLKDTERMDVFVQILKDRIAAEGKVLPGNIVKVDGFLNHRIDIGLMREMAKEFRRRFDMEGITAVLTVEASGIALGTVCAEEMGVPLLFAKKAKSDNIEGGLYQCDIYSYTYSKKVTLLLSREWLGVNDKVFIVDDFLANGEALRGLMEIVEQAGAEVIGIGVAVEKGFQPGGERIRSEGYNLQSLAIIERADQNGIIFRESKPLA